MVLRVFQALAGENPNCFKTLKLLIIEKVKIRKIKAKHLGNF